MWNKRRRLWMTVAGAAAGLLIWAFDYDFFLNAGGPAAPISRAILRASHLSAAEFPVPVLWPMLVLVTLGTGVGFVVSGFRKPPVVSD